MKKAILVTGISGTGKSTLSEKLRTMGYKTHDMDEFCVMTDKNTNLPVENHNNADLEKVKNINWTCDPNKLTSLIGQATESTFFFGATSNMDEIMSLFDLIILLEVGEKNMRERLSSRTSNDYGRTTGVQDWIMTWKEWWENNIKEKGAIVVDANQDLESVVRDVVAAVR